MELIEHFENTLRGVYSGSIGYISPQKDFDFNVIIRSIFYNQQYRYILDMVCLQLLHRLRHLFLHRIKVNYIPHQLRSLERNLLATCITAQRSSSDMLSKSAFDRHRYECPAWVKTPTKLI